MNTKVTFLMVAFNTESLVEKAVRSALNQTEKSINIIVRNNGSWDKTGEILEQLAKEDSRLTVISNKVNGVSDDGFDASNSRWWYENTSQLGEYITILDSDDFVSPNFVEKLYKKAKETDADIAVAGNYFTNGQTIMGSKLPPVLKSTLSEEIGDDFQGIHRCFRTWWGKLYTKELFTENYEMAWEKRAPIWWNIDTIVMMNYLKASRKIATLQEPLYYMYVREDSTYNLRILDRGRLLEDYAIHGSMLDALKTLKIESKTNVDYVNNVHWGYLKEVIEKLPSSLVPIQKKYEYLSDIFIDDVVQKYTADNFMNMYFQIEPILKQLDQSESIYNVYQNYLARLNSYIQMIDEDGMNPIAFAVLIGAVFDSDNRTNFGMEFLSLPMSIVTKGTKGVVEAHPQIKKWWAVHPKDIALYMNEEDWATEMFGMQEELRNLWHTDCDEALNLAIGILIKYPVDLMSLMYVRNLYRNSNDMKNYNLLNETIKVLWDKEKIGIVETF